MKKEIGKRVQNAREYAGMTQELLAEKLDISTSAISRLETGRSMVSIEKLYKISQVLGIGLQDLLCDFFVITPKDESLSHELEHYISTMTASDKAYLVEYIKLNKKYYDK